MTYEVSRSGPQTWNIALNREHWREQGKEKRSAPGRVANPMSQVIFQTTSKDGNDIML